MAATCIELAHARPDRAGTNPSRDRPTTSYRIFARVSDNGFQKVAVITVPHDRPEVRITGHSNFNMVARRTWSMAAFWTNFEQIRSFLRMKADRG